MLAVGTAGLLVRRAACWSASGSTTAAGRPSRTSTWAGGQRRAGPRTRTVPAAVVFHAEASHTGIRDPACHRPPGPGATAPAATWTLLANVRRVGRCRSSPYGCSSARCCARWACCSCARPVRPSGDVAGVLVGAAAARPARGSARRARRRTGDGPAPPGPAAARAVVDALPARPRRAGRHRRPPWRGELGLCRSRCRAPDGVVAQPGPAQPASPGACSSSPSPRCVAGRDLWASGARRVARCCPPRTVPPHGGSLYGDAVHRVGGRLGRPRTAVPPAAGGARHPPRSAAPTPRLTLRAARVRPAGRGRSGTLPAPAVRRAPRRGLGRADVRAAPRHRRRLGAGPPRHPRRREPCCPGWRPRRAAPRAGGLVGRTLARGLGYGGVAGGRVRVRAPGLWCWRRPWWCCSLVPGLLWRPVRRVGPHCWCRRSGPRRCWCPGASAIWPWQGISRAAARGRDAALRTCCPASTRWTWLSGRAGDGAAPAWVTAALAAGGRRWRCCAGRPRRRGARRAGLVALARAGGRGRPRRGRPCPDRVGVDEQPVAGRSRCSCPGGLGDRGSRSPRTGLRASLAGRSFGWRQPLASCCSASSPSQHPVLALGWWVWQAPGTTCWDAATDALPAYMADAADRDPDRRHAGRARGRATAGYSYEVAVGHTLRARRGGRAPSRRRRGAAHRAVDRPADRPVAGRPSTELGRDGVAYVFAPAPVDGDLAAGLDAAAGLTPSATGRPRRPGLAARGARRPTASAGGRTGWRRPALLVAQALLLLVALVLAAPSRRRR